MARFAFVADDLTGAGDVLAQAHAHGLDAVLAIGDAPLPADADVVGIAGPARSLGGAAFDRQVRGDLSRISEVDAEVVLYKVCSTFDSAPTLGSIGRGIELLHERFPGHGPVPVVPAQPGFGRFTAFSQHFAAFGDQIYRLDRHPVMATHPSTPMSDADLRNLLSHQFGDHRVPEALHLPAYGDGSFDASWKALRSNENSPAFVVDAVSDAQLDAVASALRRDSSRGEPALVVGSGGIMTALAKSAGAGGVGAGTDRAGGPVLVVSASASSVTARQLDDARQHGWDEIPVPARLLHERDDELTRTLVADVSNALGAGRNVMVHTTLGAGDPRYSTTRTVSAQHVGTVLGELAATMATQSLTSDIVVFGGDTSSHALAAMDVRYLRVARQFVTAGPICTADDDSSVAGCRLLLKGGQVGPVDILRRFAAPTSA
ncbi:four-carbon acid sugar kinase family protein [Gordonia sp. KTR9]|uniref:four-carbon acid sugar kinase family protein n=1 Tax=Gordonia sp. KTR9 TaxID=337191 RepID=UPI00027DE4AC|nr:four-carbon acid sugar kinase family protein [Gordonia sp. KTR9]AFR49198.1 hypothetical protein KTR9_2561 [Gordonia sp. KTR9]